MKEDVESVVVEKKPKNCIGNITYLTDGPTSQKSTADRKTLHRNDEFIVEDVLDPSGEVTRRLIAIKNYLRPQAQVVLDTAEGTLDAQSDAWGLVKPSVNKKPVKNVKMLDYAYNRALFLAVNAFGKSGKQTGTIIGLGSGILGDFMKHYTPALQLTEVESNPLVIELAKKYFFYDRPAVQKDGAEFVEGLAQGSQDFIIVDVDDTNESEGGVPSKAFCSHKFISKAHAALTEGGVLAIVVVPKAGSLLKELQEEIMQVFGHGWDMPALREEFHVYVCIKSQDSKDWAKSSKKRLTEVKTSILKGSNDDWEENEFPDLAAGVTELTLHKEESMTK